MTVFIILRNGSVSFSSTMGKLCLGLFFVCINVFSAQIWADFCRKIGPIATESTGLIM